jgi:hypothetical protein
MGEADNRRLLENLFGVGPVTLSAEAETRRARADDFVMEMPQISVRWCQVRQTDGTRRAVAGSELRFETPNPATTARACAPDAA